jgi:thiol-disulfide isomerase/thioredoxin
MKILTILVGLILTATSALAGTVNVLPMKPKRGAEITIEYQFQKNDPAAPAPGAQLHAATYQFTAANDIPTAVEVPLAKDGDRYSGGFTPITDAVFILVKVGNGTWYDTNKDVYWTVMIHDERGPVLGAQYRNALSCLGQLPENCRRKEDPAELFDMLDGEVRSHPQNALGRVSRDLMSLKSKDMTQAEVTADLTALTKSMKVPPTVSDALALSQAYQYLQQPQEADRVLAEASQRFPGTEISEQRALGQLQLAESLEVFMQRARQFLMDHPRSSSRINLMQAMITTAADQRRIDLLISAFESMLALPPQIAYQSANYLGAVDSLRSSALSIADVGIRNATIEQGTSRPVYIGPSEWAEMCRTSVSNLWFVKGAIHSAMGLTDEAMSELQKSIDAGGAQTDANTFGMYVGLLRSAGKQPEAITIAEKAMAFGAASAQLTTTWRDMMRASGATDADIADREAELKKQALVVARERLVKEMLNQASIAGAFTTLDGKPVTLADWKGKVVIVDYWATWCGPCRQSFPSMQKLYEKYRSNPNVVFAIVNVWERDKQKDRPTIVREFLQQNPSYTFPMYIDPTDDVVSRFGVTGIPTKFYIGKDGRIQFKEVGYLPEEQFLDVATKKIELLLAQ